MKQTTISVEESVQNAQENMATGSLDRLSNVHCDICGDPLVVGEIAAHIGSGMVDYGWVEDTEVSMHICEKCNRLLAAHIIKLKREQA